MWRGSCFSVSPSVHPFPRGWPPPLSLCARACVRASLSLCQPCLNHRPLDINSRRYEPRTAVFLSRKGSGSSALHGDRGSIVFAQAVQMAERDLAGGRSLGPAALSGMPAQVPFTQLFIGFGPRSVNLLKICKLVQQSNVAED